MSCARCRLGSCSDIIMLNEKIGCNEGRMVLSSISVPNPV